MRLIKNITSRRIPLPITLALLLMAVLLMAASLASFIGISTTGAANRQSLPKPVSLSPQSVLSSSQSITLSPRVEEIEYPQVELQQIQRILSTNTKDLSEAIAPNFSQIKPHLNAKSLGIIVPHHLIAAQALELTYDWISDYQPDVIVLLTPNHQQLIKAPLIARTDALMADRQFFSMDSVVKDYANQGLVTIDNVSFLKEHGFYNHLPFIGANRWQVPIIPVAMARNASLDSLTALKNAINDSFSNQKVLWIASIDFSHYLPAASATIKDEQTKQWIEKKDYNSILESTSDHLDAPAVLVMWLMQFENTHFIWQSNSAQITGGGHHLPGTSYIIYYGN